MATPTDSVDRAQHLAWCKQRALQYVDAGEFDNAFASMTSDLESHPATRGQYATVNMLGMAQLISGRLNNARAMRDWINGYN